MEVAATWLNVVHQRETMKLSNFRRTDTITVCCVRLAVATSIRARAAAPRHAAPWHATPEVSPCTEERVTRRPAECSDRWTATRRRRRGCWERRPRRLPACTAAARRRSLRAAGTRSRTRPWPSTSRRCLKTLKCGMELQNWEEFRISG